MVVAVLALVFSILFIWYSRNTGHSFFVYWAPFVLTGGALLLGIPVLPRCWRAARLWAGSL
jgi:APA family basic amino acid/polyamine antiporter